FKQACFNANRIIAISQQTKRDIIDFFKIDENKIDVVYQGCHPIFKERSPGDKLDEVKEKYNLPESYLLCVGTVERRKNQLLILQALTKLDNHIHAVITGKATSYKKELLDFIEKHNLYERVVFLENVPFDDLPTIYQMSKIFVYPSRFEGFGIPLLEALNSGVPVIGATGSCLEEAGGPHSFYVSPDDADALSSAIRQILQDETLRKKMIEEGFKYAEQFTEENIAKNIMNVYQKTLQNV
ncbi:glycosyltransferase family 1 protein, partial [Pseudoxanthomonas sp. SGD-10]